MIKPRGSQFVLYTKDGKRVLGVHDSKEDARKQEIAIEISKHYKPKKSKLKVK